MRTPTIKRASGAAPLALGVWLAACGGRAGGLDGEPASSASGAGEGSGGDGADGADLPPDGPPPSTDACGPDTWGVGPSLLRRLTRLEYRSSLRALLHLDALPDVELVPADPTEEGFRTVARLNALSSQHLRAYLDVAERLGADLMADEVRRAEVIGCDVSAPACLRAFVARFGREAFRRPLTAQEVDARVAAAGDAALEPLDAFRFVLESFLASPQFLLRVEGTGAPGTLVELSPHELASRMSFAIWGTGPSEELLAAAEAGELGTSEGRRAQAAAMLADPRAQDFYGAFFEQWLGFENLRAPPAEEAPPGWVDAHLDAFKDQTQSLLREMAWSEGVSFFDVLTANHTRLGPEAASFLELPVDADGQHVFAEDDPRAHTGLLTHPALLSAKSDGDLVSKRGAWIRHTFLCQTFEVPPGLFEMLGDDLVGLSYAEILDKRNEEAACAGCHAMIDPIGVGFTAWDQLGLYDATSELGTFGITPAVPMAPGDTRAPFGSVAELGARLGAMAETRACLSERLFLYLQGRSAGDTDACTLDAANEALSTSGSFSELVSTLVSHDQFRFRRNPQ